MALAITVLFKIAFYRVPYLIQPKKKQLLSFLVDKATLMGV
jgi:hypothetical protein